MNLGQRGRSWVIILASNLFLLPAISNSAKPQTDPGTAMPLQELPAWHNELMELVQDLPAADPLAEQLSDLPPLRVSGGGDQFHTIAILRDVVGKWGVQGLVSFFLDTYCPDIRPDFNKLIFVTLADLLRENGESAALTVGLNTIAARSTGDRPTMTLIGVARAALAAGGKEGGKLLASLMLWNYDQLDAAATIVVALSDFNHAGQDFQVPSAELRQALEKLPSLDQIWRDYCRLLLTLGGDDPALAPTMAELFAWADQAVAPEAANHFLNHAIARENLSPEEKVVRSNGLLARTDPVNGFPWDLDINRLARLADLGDLAARERLKLLAQLYGNSQVKSSIRDDGREQQLSPLSKKLIEWLRRLHEQAIANNWIRELFEPSPEARARQNISALVKGIQNPTFGDLVATLRRNGTSLVVNDPAANELFGKLAQAAVTSAAATRRSPTAPPIPEPILQQLAALCAEQARAGQLKALPASLLKVRLAEIMPRR